MLDRDQIEAPQFSAQTGTPASTSTPSNPFSPMALAFLPLRMGLEMFKTLDQERHQSSILRHNRRKTNV